MILITGSSGLLGRALRTRMEALSTGVRTFDILDNEDQDTRNSENLKNAMKGVRGIVHLAAISRVVWAQNNPALCQAVNVAALRDIIEIAASMPQKPWIVFASSREVYGEAASLPVAEDAPLAPVNVYARSKVAGELLMADAREAGLLANVVRFSNVYGCENDHADRVVTAFARTAAYGGTLRLEGADNMFDFTHVDDAANGLARAVLATNSGEAFPPIHFLTGRGTTLGELAQLAMRSAKAPVDAVLAPSRSFDVARFVGDPSRAAAELGWSARIDIEQGIDDLVGRFRRTGLPDASPSFMDVFAQLESEAASAPKIANGIG